MRKIILETLEEIACPNTGHCQINMQSDGARQMIANKLEEKLQPHVNKLIEEIIVGISKECKRLKEGQNESI